LPTSSVGIVLAAQPYQHRDQPAIGGFAFEVWRDQDATMLT
jgi:hypothetical protein